jgi:wyosine [tRNA(Phe)-imidazoG37] synthetase (radical SAM superfamily)
MSSGASPLAFGQVPSRCFGRSLGINNTPPKSCSYSCVYCQVGRLREGLEQAARLGPLVMTGTVSSACPVDGS